MTSVRWYFGATGFMVDIVNTEGNESQFTSTMPVDDMNLRFEFPPGAAPTTAAAPTTGAAPTTAAASNATSFTPMQVEPGVPGAVQTDLYPFVVKADVCFTDEATINAEWLVTPQRISGKGVGKGLGKRITTLRAGPY